MTKQETRLINLNYHLATLNESIKHNKMLIKAEDMETNIEGRKELYKDEREKFNVITEIRALSKVPDNYNLNEKLRETEQILAMFLYHKQTLEMEIQYCSKFGDIVNQYLEKERVEMMIKSRKKIFNANIELSNLVNEINAKQEFLKEYKVRVEEAKTYDETELKNAKNKLPDMINQAKELIKTPKLSPVYIDRLKSFIETYQNNKWNFNSMTNEQAIMVRTFYIAMNSELKIINNILS
ncbi:MAG: hypothetical protein WCT85_01480 [Parachlamydiales bacterium]|jgi:hypothetical protein